MNLPQVSIAPDSLLLNVNVRNVSLVHSENAIRDLHLVVRIKLVQDHFREPDVAPSKQVLGLGTVGTLAA